MVACNSPTKPIRKYKAVTRRPKPTTSGKRGKNQKVVPESASAQPASPPTESALGWDDDVIDEPSSQPAVRDPPSQLPLYVEAVEAFSAGFYHAGGSLFVVEGWNIQRGESTVSI